MNAYGIKGNLLKWFESYLQDRKQKVVSRQAHSSLACVSAGVHQGSVLGHLLFLIYINDICENLMSLSRLFADDTSLSFASTNATEIKRVIDHDLNELVNWSTKWLMCFNPDKTEIMLFSNKEASDTLEFTFNG